MCRGLIMSQALSGYVRRGFSFLVSPSSLFVPVSIVIRRENRSSSIDTACSSPSPSPPPSPDPPPSPEPSPSCILPLSSPPLPSLSLPSLSGCMRRRLDDRAADDDDDDEEDEEEEEDALWGLLPPTAPPPRTRAMLIATVSERVH